VAPVPVSAPVPPNPLPPSFSVSRTSPPRALHSFPTRRSSDLPLTGAPTSPSFRLAHCWSLPTLTTSGPNTWSSSGRRWEAASARSEEHTSELQSRSDLVCRLLLEKKQRNI